MIYPRRYGKTQRLNARAVWKALDLPQMTQHSLEVEDVRKFEDIPILDPDVN